MAPSLNFGERSVRISTLERVMWPRIGMTKGEMIDYYLRIAPVMLPHIAGRPTTLRRFPEGVDGPNFYQTRCPPHPEWLRTQHMYIFSSGKDVDAPVIDDVEGITWAANLATIEFHPYLARAERLEQPDFMVFDLDPGPPADVFDACEVALRLRDLLDRVGLVSFAKTSGGVGMHVYVAVRDHGYPETKAFARELARILVKQDPDRVTDQMSRSLRPGKVFVDWSQNDPGKSTVAPYSLRAQELPTVSMPLLWDEVEAMIARRDAASIVFGPGETFERIERHGDVFAEVLEAPQRLPL